MRSCAAHGDDFLSHYAPETPQPVHAWTGLFVFTAEPGATPALAFPPRLRAFAFMLRVALPNKGRLASAARELLSEAGVPVAAEVAPRLGIADAIVDLTSSGTTLRANGLRPIATVLESTAHLVAGASWRDADKRSAREELALALR